MSSQIYHIPTIPPDLCREDTILQIADTLQYLNKVTDDTFSRISKRVEDNHRRLAKVNDRVSLARAKVSKLQGSNKATKVFACAKYPSPEFLEEYQSVFEQQHSLKNIPKSHAKLQHNKPLVVDEKILKEKLQYYNVHLNVKSKQRDDGGEGLGRLPRNIPSISSLLLFNTTENPYKKYVMLDPLGCVTKTRQDVGEHDQDGLTEAPSSIAQNEEIKRHATDNYFYVPTIGLVPEIMAPSSLPDLTGVADDEFFLADQGPSIAPSVPSSVPDLPSVPSQEAEVPTGPAASSPVAPSSIASPPPPPPPPPPAAPSPPSTVPPPPSGPSVPPPPPPPPPPPDDDVDDDDDDDDNAKSGDRVSNSKAPAPSSGGDTWGDLLKSIRDAGGAKKANLKKANETERKRKKKKKKNNDEDTDTDDTTNATSSGGGDLMADLAKKLMMRRRGIMGNLAQSGSGSKEKEPSSTPANSGNVMDKISAMIAPPPTNTDDDAQSDSDFD